MKRSGVILIAALAALAGCKAPGQSTRLTIGDFQTMTAQMAQSLLKSDFLAQRGPGSPPAYIVINRVENLTSDVIPPSEQWMLMARLQGSMPVRDLTRAKNVHFQITPEQFATLRQAGYQGTLSEAPATTHVMKATFRSAARVARSLKENVVDLRADYYYLEYTIVDVLTRRTMWNDKFEFKRQASGLAID